MSFRLYKTSDESEDLSQLENLDIAKKRKSLALKYESRAKRLGMIL
jgi:hypothetical protein